jgi:hypothetical protein
MAGPFLTDLRTSYPDMKVVFDESALTDLEVLERNVLLRFKQYERTARTLVGALAGQPSPSMRCGTCSPAPVSHRNRHKEGLAPPAGAAVALLLI